MVTDAWWWIEPLIKRLCRRAHGELSAAGLREQALSGSLLLWVATSPAQTPAPLALIVTKLEDWSGETVCRIYGVAGSLRVISEIMDEGMARIKAMGASRVVFEGRFGWQKALKDFRPMKIVMERKL